MNSGISGSLARGIRVLGTLEFGPCSDIRFRFFDGLNPDDRDPACGGLKLAVAFSAAARIVLVDFPAVAATGTSFLVDVPVSGGAAGSPLLVGGEWEGIGIVMSAVPDADGSSLILQSSEGLGVSGRVTLAEGDAMSAICTSSVALSVGLGSPDCLWFPELIGDVDIAEWVPENSW